MWEGEQNEMEIMERLAAEEELVWMNPQYEKEIDKASELSMLDIEDAEGRLERFAPFIERCFPETKESHGIIESPFCEIRKIAEEFKIPGRLFLKLDSHLPIAGSVKARGGIYEVLKHTEELAFEHGLLNEEENYAKLAEEQYREFFSQYTIQVGSTGNLGLSIGIASAAIGYRVIVHMSADAKEWKKNLLRSHGVTVMEYESDYSEAVKSGRKLSDEDPNSYFVDDENSKNLFLGYAVAAKRLEKQLCEAKIPVDEEHPLFVYIPCGVGGAPGGVTFGLKEIFGANVHCFFIEPTKAPCMLLGMATEKHHEICVQDIGLSGVTEADGLAVGRPSGFVGKEMVPKLSGIFTIKDKKLYEYMRKIKNTEGIFLEPSACAALEGPVKLFTYQEGRDYIAAHGLRDKMEQAVHIAWATGGSLVPEEIRTIYENTMLEEV